VTAYARLDRDRSVDDLIRLMETLSGYRWVGGWDGSSPHPLTERIEEIEAEIDRRLGAGGVV
jgi:hypothetical protein